MRIVNAAQMRGAARRTTDDIGIASLVLMENAGRQAVAAMEALFPDLLDRQVAVLCGRGNNGGDGFVIARTLEQRGVDVSVFLTGRVADVRGDARTNLEILGRLGLTVVEIADSQAWELHFSEVSDCTLIVDAIFGTGLNAPVAGSRGKPGAAHLAAVGALRSGAGLVTVATPAGCLPILAAMAPEYMTVPLQERDDGLGGGDLDRLLEMARDVVAIGPGLGQATVTRDFIRQLVDRATMPLVVDADGLNAFAGDPAALTGREGRDIIITPHPGEMARLVGMSTDAVQPSRIDVARNFARAHHLFVVLKGHRTLIATPDEKIFINPTGNPGMATGGTGDVLTGMIAAWLAQLLDAEAACKLAVYLHGLAGDLAEADEGDVAMTSADVAGHLGDAMMELTARRKVVERDRST